MRFILLIVLSLLGIGLRAQGDKSLAATGTDDLPLIIGIVLAILVIIAMYFLLRKADK